MIKEHDRVVLTGDLPREHLKAGDVGTVVHVYSDGGAFEVEFLTQVGKIAALSTVMAAQVRPVTEHDITHARLRELPV